MPSNAGAIAMLNQAAGKKSPRKSKPRAVHASELQFSPEKTPADKTGSKRKRLPTFQQHDAVRNPFPLPAQNDEAHPDFTPMPKKQRRLKKNAGAVDPSPLKQLGYNPQELNATQVNLNESPRKRARGIRGQDMAVQLAVSKEKKRRMGSRRKTRLSVGQGVHEPPPSTWDDARETAATTIDEGGPEGEDATGRQSTEPDLPSHQSREATSAESTSSERGEDDEDKADEEEANDGEEGEEISDRDAMDDARNDEPNDNSTSHTAAGAPPEAEQHEQRNHTDKTATQPTRKKMPKSVIDHKQEEEEKHEKLRQEYIEGIEDVARIHRCYTCWRNAGGVGRRLRKMFSEAVPLSHTGKAFQRRFKELRQQHRLLRIGKVDAETSQADARDVMTRLTGLCMSMDTALSPTQRSKIVQDLYRHVIPDAMEALKSLLKVHADKTSFPPDVLEELVQLLRLADDLCRRASKWKPRPTMLEEGVLDWVRTELYPSLRIIVQSFELEYGDLEYRRKERIVIEELVQKQKACDQRLAQRRAEMYARSSSVSTCRRPPEPRSEHYADIIDIDDVLAATADNQGREERQPTEDIPPRLPASWTESEQTALLNGLQNHRGSGRFWKILEDNDIVLKKRTVDDLQTAALYFKEVFMTALEFKDMEDEQFSWIASVGTESAMAQTELMA